MTTINYHCAASYLNYIVIYAEAIMLYWNSVIDNRL